MVPGVGAGSWLWNSMAPDLSKNYELIMPHLRGSGRSEKPDHSYSVPQMAEDMTAIVDQMGYEKFHILGVSLGGYIAQQFAIRWPKRWHHWH